MMEGKGFKVIQNWWKSPISKRQVLTVQSEGVEIWFYIEPSCNIIYVIKARYKEANDFFNICCELVKNQPKFKSINDSKDYIDNLLKRADKLILYS